MLEKPKNRMMWIHSSCINWGYKLRFRVINRYILVKIFLVVILFKLWRTPHGTSQSSRKYIQPFMRIRYYHSTLMQVPVIRCTQHLYLFCWFWSWIYIFFIIFVNTFILNRKMCSILTFFHLENKSYHYVLLSAFRGRLTISVFFNLLSFIISLCIQQWIINE